MGERLTIQEIQLLGGGREVEFPFALNLIRGPIGSGKSTLVRLLRSLVASVPRQLPRETDRVEALAGRLQLGLSSYSVYRPLVTTHTAPVEISEMPEPSREISTISSTSDLPEAGTSAEPESFRLPATGAASSYSTFMLEKLDMPVISVPRARTETNSAFSPVSFTDWLGFCIVTGDEIDLQVFGHSDPFRDIKRRWVFEVAYGFYDVERAKLAAELRSIELQLQALEGEALVREKFLADARWRKSAEVTDAIEETARQLDMARDARIEQVADLPAAEVGDLRDRVLALREQRDSAGTEVRALGDQIEELRDLEKQLISQSARLTRAIVSDEWFVDFDFVVCPRCGTSVSPDRGHADTCYLCLQEPEPSMSRETLLAEQERVVSQQAETERIIELRERSLFASQDSLARVSRDLADASAELESRTDSYVSDRAAEIREQAAQEARLVERLSNLEEHLVALERHERSELMQDELRREADRVRGEIEQANSTAQIADANVRALEERMHEYLEALHLPEFEDGLSVKVNRQNYLPEVSGRRFDELSSQGIKTLVNVAHALAHHTVSVDRELPIPGLLVLDGISANAGKEGFDQARIDDAYRLIARISEEYGDDLQIITSDNALPTAVFAPDDARIVLTLTDTDRLIR